MIAHTCCLFSWFWQHCGSKLAGYGDTQAVDILGAVVLFMNERVHVNSHSLTCRADTLLLHLLLLISDRCPPFKMAMFHDKFPCDHSRQLISQADLQQILAKGLPKLICNA